ncbi:Homeobox domain-containing protein [Meloidogyne graminicola]|uniref:Homeobox domain-containing protein n=1 Tax=Meloidogyne graminicola TaxID=189291 RepID=A0A8S9ZUI7_9BILA|nr:Homeobox domain-containing protein [Meloidogyne graminicola]
MSTASFLIDDLLTKSKENSLKEENKNELTKAITSQIFGQNNLLNEFIIEKIQKEEESKIQNLEKKVCQSEEEFNNKIKLEQDINELSFKSLANQIIEQKKLENGFIPAWFSPFNQQHKGINNSLILANHCIKSLPLPTKFITNLNNKSTLNNNSNFFPFFGHFINNIYPKSTQQNYLNIQNQQKRKGGQIRFSNEQTDVLERTFETKKIFI